MKTLPMSVTYSKYLAYFTKGRLALGMDGEACVSNPYYSAELLNILIVTQGIYLKQILVGFSKLFKVLLFH